MVVIQLSGTVLYFINSLVAVFFGVVEVLSLFGYNVICLVRLIINALTSVWRCILQSAEYGREDFVKFLMDVADILDGIHHLIFDSTVSGIVSIKEFFVTSNEVVLNFLRIIFDSPSDNRSTLFCTFWSFLVNFCDLLFGALALIGKAALITLKCIWLFMINIPQFPLLLYLYCKEKWIFIFEWLTQEACLGLLILTAGSWVTFKLNLHKPLLKRIRFILLLCMEYIVHNSSLFLKNLRKFFQNTRQHFLSNSPNKEKLSKLLETERAEKLCIVCMDNRRNTVLLTCNHLILCTPCALTVLNDSGTCPVCRTPIITLVDVYI